MTEPTTTHLLAKRYDSSDLGGISRDQLRETGAQTARHIVLALDSTDTAERLLQWAIVNLFRKGDVFHIVHVALVLSSQDEVHHQTPGLSLSVHERSFEKAQIDADRAKAFVRERCVPAASRHASAGPVCPGYGRVQSVRWHKYQEFAAEEPELLCE